MGMDSIPGVNKINWFSLYFTIWMWSSCKDTFSVLCQWFHRCIRILEEQWGVRVLFSLQTLDNITGQCTFMCQLHPSLWTLSIWPCLLSLLQMHSWKGLVMPSCSTQHSPFIIRRQSEEIDKIVQSDPFFSKKDYLEQSFTAPERANANKKHSQTAKLPAMGLWWFCNGTLGKTKTRKCYKST